MKFIELKSGDVLINYETKVKSIYVILTGSFSIQYISNNTGADKIDREKSLYMPSSALGDFSPFGGKRWK